MDLLAEFVEQQLRAAIAEEREACAAIVEHGATPRCSIDGKRVPDPVLLRVAAAIRASR